VSEPEPQVAHPWDLPTQAEHDRYHAADDEEEVRDVDDGDQIGGQVREDADAAERSDIT